MKHTVLFLALETCCFRDSNRRTNMNRHSHNSTYSGTDCWASRYTKCTYLTLIPLVEQSPSEVILSSVYSASSTWTAYTSILKRSLCFVHVHHCLPLKAFPGRCCLLVTDSQSHPQAQWYDISLRLLANFLFNNPQEPIRNSKQLVYCTRPCSCTSWPHPKRQLFMLLLSRQCDYLTEMTWSKFLFGFCFLKDVVLKAWSATKCFSLVEWGPA